MYFAHNIQILTSICTDNNNLIGCANGCIWKVSRRKRGRDEKKEVSIAIGVEMWREAGMSIRKL
jgi:hypothetical protein